MSGRSATRTHQLFELVGEAYGFEDLDEFRPGILEVLNRAVPSPWVSYNEVGLDPRRPTRSWCLRRRRTSRDLRAPLAPEPDPRGVPPHRRRAPAAVLRDVLLVEGGTGELTVPALRGLGLTERQAQTLQWVALGYSAASAAAHLGIARRTADKHLQHVYAKLGVSTLAEATATAWAAVGASLDG
jgi:DNA-binding CsgD family transcriptional regulator